MENHTSQLIIYRWGTPNKWDQLPFGTICEVFNKKEDSFYYIQNSKNEKKPRWEQTNPPWIT